MNRRVLVTDVTDLGIGLACVAGVDLATHRTIRLGSPRPSVEMLDRTGGLVPGSVVDVSWEPDLAPIPPHVEDGRWTPETLMKRAGISEQELFKFLGGNAFDSLTHAFGQPIKKGSKGNVAYPPGKGSRSVATLRVEGVRLHLEWGKIRVDFEDRAKAKYSSVPLQDLAVKLHRDSCPACEKQFERMLRSEFEGPDALLRVGLAREWNGGCWLQVNSICLGKRHHFVPLTK